MFTVKCDFAGSVGSSVVPGVDGTSPDVAVASFATDPFTKSASVTTCDASNSSLAPGAKLSIVHVSFVNLSSTVIPVTV